MGASLTVANLLFVIKDSREKVAEGQKSLKNLGEGK
jgi:hypothetical protein